MVRLVRRVCPVQAAANDGRDADALKPRGRGSDAADILKKVLSTGAEGIMIE